MVSERIKGKLHQPNSSAIESTMASKSIPRSWTKADDEDRQQLAAHGPVQEFRLPPLDHLIGSPKRLALYPARCGANNKRTYGPQCSARVRRLSELSSVVMECLLSALMDYSVARMHAK
jgi:hypothetical protein